MHVIIRNGGACSQEGVGEGATVANDEMQAALALWSQWKDNPEACLRIASHGQRLIGLGDHDADFQRCSGRDQLSVVPTQAEPGVLRAVSG